MTRYYNWVVLPYTNTFKALKIELHACFIRLHRLAVLSYTKFNTDNKNEHLCHVLTLAKHQRSLTSVEIPYKNTLRVESSPKIQRD